MLLQAGILSKKSIAAYYFYKSYIGISICRHRIIHLIGGVAVYQIIDDISGGILYHLSDYDRMIGVSVD